MALGFLLTVKNHKTGKTIVPRRETAAAAAFRNGGP